MTIVERAKRKAARRERWDVATRALDQIKINKEEGERLWLHMQDHKYFRLMDLNKVLSITFEKHRYRLKDYFEEIQDFIWMVM